MTDEPVETLEELVVRRIREQLGEQGLEELLKAFNQGKKAAGAQLSGEGTLRVEVEGIASAEVVPAPSVTVEMIESTLPELAGDIRGRSPQDINFAVNLYVALLQTLQVLLMVYQMVHGEPPNHQQVVEIFNHTTNVYNQTTNIVQNMPGSPG